VNRPCFDGKPIASIASLARALRIHQRQLTWVIDHADQLYRELPPRIKPDGSFRQLFNPAAQLKEIQRRINRYIFSRVSFPIYLQGGIRDKKDPRHCRVNAMLHSGAKIIVNEDISGFFPSITGQQVRNIWQYFFCFPPGIAAALTRLTTHHGQLPQGAPTSSYLANLALWKHEPATVDALSRKGIRYSRYIDDITLSSACFQNNNGKTDMVAGIRSMCDKNNFLVKRSKHRIESSGQPMRVNNLQINHGVTLPKKERARIRAAVRSCEIHAAQDQASKEYKTIFNSTRGRVNHLRQLHRNEARLLLLRLDTCTPIQHT